MALSEIFKPGLIDIGLDIEKSPSNHFLSFEIQLLTICLEAKPIYMRPAIHHLGAIFSFHMDFDKVDTRLMLEELIVEYPNDLNILADLIYIYRIMDRERDSDRYKELLELHKDKPLLQAKSMLSQAHGLAYDFPVDVVETFPWKSYERQIDVREIAVKKFEEGIKMLENLNCSKEEILTWKHNLGIARASLDNWRKKRGDDTFSRSKDVIKVLETHLDVIETCLPIEHLEEPLKKCVAKSCIFFAQYYLEVCDCIDYALLPERIKRQHVGSLITKAMSICPNDFYILRRYGDYEAKTNRNYLAAIDLYGRSISIYPDIDHNWLTYALRIDAYYYYSMELVKKRSDKDQINKYLELAYNDGKLYFQSKCRKFSMIRMAQICFQRAMPDNGLGISFCCEHIDYIHEALDTIYKELDKKGTFEWRIYIDLGKYYPYIGEYRKAIESLKNALELNKWPTKYPYPFLDLCRCFVAFYKSKKDKDLLTEFSLMLKVAKKNHFSYWITVAMRMMRAHSPDMLLELVQDMIECDVRDCESLIQEGLNQSFCRNLPESAIICRNLRRRVETELQEINDKESDINGPMEIQKSQNTEKFQYDFFVSYTENEEEWVNYMLQPQLEEFGDKSGYILSRDSVPGNLKIGSMAGGMNQSLNLLIVLTPSYLEDNWEKLVMRTMISSVTKTTMEGQTIIPIVLKECEIPLELESFTPIFFTEKVDWVQLRMRFVANRDSETGFERRMSALDTCDIDKN